MAEYYIRPLGATQTGNVSAIRFLDPKFLDRCSVGFFAYLLLLKSYSMFFFYLAGTSHSVQKIEDFWQFWTLAVVW